jgi:maleate cis-trans isomerase
MNKSIQHHPKRLCEEIRIVYGLTRRQLSKIIDVTASSIMSYETRTPTFASNMPAHVLLNIIFSVMNIKSIGGSKYEINIEKAISENKEIKRIIGQRKNRKAKGKKASS